MKSNIDKKLETERREDSVSGNTISGETVSLSHFKEYLLRRVETWLCDRKSALWMQMAGRYVDFWRYSLCGVENMARLGSAVFGGTRWQCPTSYSAWRFPARLAESNENNTVL